MPKLLQRKKTWFFACLVLLVVGWLFFGRSDSAFPAGVEIGVVERGTVIEIVNETGFVQAAQAVELAFERSGRVVAMPVDEGAIVAAGTPLIQLDDLSAAADLAAAEARVSAERARLSELLVGADPTSLAVTTAAVTAAEIALANAERNLIKVTNQQNQLVANAEALFTTNGLQAYLVAGEREDARYTYAAPVISGTYTGTKPGVYTIELYDSAADSGSSFRTTGLEVFTGSVSTVHPTPLGTSGLYIQFPANFARRTTWEIPVPNNRGSSYSANEAALAAAKAGQTVAIAAAENNVASAKAALVQSQRQLTQIAGSARTERVAAQQAVLTQMVSSLTQAQIQYDNTTLTAPFAGVVTSRTVEVGQVVAAGAPAVSLISADAFELQVEISEVDIAELTIGDEAIVQLDAYPDDYFSARVEQVSPNARVVDGVRVFIVTLAFENSSDKIKAGLSADINITTAVREAVVAVPTRSIYEDATGKFVRVVTADDEVIKVPVTTGLRGSNGQTEIVAGLTGGETIITFANQADLMLLERTQ